MSCLIELQINFPDKNLLISYGILQEYNIIFVPVWVFIYNQVTPY